MIRQGFWLCLLGGAVWLAAQAPAMAQSCSTQNGIYTCNIAAGSYSSELSLYNLAASPTMVTSAGNITTPASVNYTTPAWTSALTVAVIGNPVTPYTSGLVITNTGSLELTPGSQNPIPNYVYGLFAQETGYPASPRSGDTYSSSSPLPQQLTITNSGTINISLGGVTTLGGGALVALAQGGQGETVAGGNSGGVAITNSGEILASITANGYGGIEALAQGGSLGPSDTGAYSLSSTVTSSAPVKVYATWADWLDNPVNSGMYGVLAQSVGGDGGDSNGQDNGGAGGRVLSAAVTLTAGGDVRLATYSTAPTSSDLISPSAGVSAAVVGGNGGQGANEESVNAGEGGHVGSAQITVTDANVEVSGDTLPGLLAFAQGGTGGVGGDPNCSLSCQSFTNGGNGNDAGEDEDNAASIQVTGATLPVTISTAGTDSPAVAALVQGGAGGAGGNANALGDTTGGNGGDGGDIDAPITIQLAGTTQTPVNLTTSGDTSPGILALSAGGTGGEGGDAQRNGHYTTGGNGGSGGAGGGITVSLASTSIATSGTASSGIVAVSEGSLGGEGGEADAGLGSGTSGNGGAGGSAGDVTITLDAASSISTTNTDSSGIVAQSLSGGGANSNWAGGLSTTGGNGGAGGNAGNVTVTNNGKIVTNGTTARGILAQSMPGAGGSGGSTGVGFYGSGGTGASSGTAGAVTVQHNGSITTTGANAQGILAQSIGGAGGAGGQGSGVIAAVGGDASTNPLTADGGTVDIGTYYGSITTSGISAIGVLGQSIGGGGGDGGGVSSVVVSVGGTGGAGGDGGAVTSTSNQYTTITTNGDMAPAFVLQSIGGGGGNAGNASSDAPFVSVAIGGTSGGGGDGGSAVVYLQHPNFTTVGTKSSGLVVQSIGGGGGTGGNAFAASVGAGFSASVAVGGSGRGGGDGGAAQVQMSGGTIRTGQNPLLINGQPLGDSVDGCTTLPCNTLPVDSYGVVVQSIGGGGGLGGSASAQSLATAIPVPGTNLQVAVAASVALGGSGGDGGDGGAVQFALSNGGQIITSGQGSTAVLAQSIGGGGGAGGDSSALATAVGYFNPPEGSNSLSLVTTLTMGGNGSQGGAGGKIDVVLGGSVSNCSSSGCDIASDPDGSNPTSITTYGDFANGVVAQSIGGGGGNAGFGSSNSQGFSTSKNASVTLTLGSQGGTGGAGGDVRVDLFTGNGITTYGSGAVGLMAQSVGGGGGTSQGGSYGVGVSFTANNTNYSPGATVNLGSTGGSGNTGGDVTVSAQAPITTHGGDATGILAQSIGGGGGLGGSAGADASADNPVVEQGLDARQAVSNWGDFLRGESNGSFAANFTLSIGGPGGTADDGGTVWVALYAPIRTTGDWAGGIVAQSIGGGGGKGGSAAASGTGGLSYVTVNADVAIGGQGGTAGSGGSVTVELDQGNQGSSYDNNTSISTAGFGAAGVIAQSIGGGGGIGADGSDSATGTLSVGGADNGFIGPGGNGGPVTLSYYNPDSTSIATTGQAADGVILQSIGGGGGIAGAGSSLFASGFEQSGTLSLSAGGGAFASGAGGAVTFAPSAPDTPIAISTTGNDSFGILAQSIGGGGGIVTSQPSSSASPTLTIGGSGQFYNSSDGGAVNVTLGGQGTIATTGIGAHGIVAQSIGGGGGVLRLVNQSGDSPTVDTSVPSSLSAGANDGDGGTVDVEVDGSVSVSGAGAVAILAQSIGSGGGLVMNGNTLYAGSPNFDVSNSSGSGDAVTITANGTVSATGANGIGIFAQSTGYSNGSNGQVSVTVGGNVVGGSGQAATSDQSGNSTQSGSSAIQIDSPDGSNHGNGNVVTVNAGGSLNTMSGTDGTAIVQTGGGTTNVTNAGTVTGAIYLGGGTFTNTSGGVHNTGSVTQGDVVNHGAVNIGLPSEVRATRITGDFTQTSTGQLGVTIHSLLKIADYLQVDGAASIDGIIVPRAITLLPGTVPVVTAGTLVSTADALDSLLFRWDATQSGNTLSVTPSSNFTPAGVPLNRSQASLANYFSRAWANADTAFATHFAYMSQIATAQDYAAALNAFSGQDIQAQSIAFANTAGAILGASMSCPVFADKGVLLGEDSCAWATISGRWTNQGTTSNVQGYDVTTTSYRLGGQHEIAPNWYLGGSLAYGDTSATMNGGSRGDGYTVDGSVALKRTVGPWYFAGSAALAYGSFDTYRQINLPGVTETLESKPSIFLAGARLRAGYEFTFGDVYVRPYGDFDVIHTNLPAARESGSSIYALDVHGSSKTSIGLSAMMEVGGRIDLDEQTTLRPYASFGVSYLPDNTRAIETNFANETVNNGTFFDYIETPEFLGRIDLGLQIYRLEDFELKVGYTADIGTSYLSQSATARFAYHF
jgi:uncharacterized protein YhjY with autotransporter beta-barrel domain